jgi:hypothetical protein
MPKAAAIQPNEWVLTRDRSEGCVRNFGGQGNPDRSDGLSKPPPDGMRSRNVR